MENRFHILKNSFAIEFNKIIDIGANNGEWAKMIKRVYPQAFVLCLEANKQCASKLIEKNLDYEICLLGNENKFDVPYYSNNNSVDCTGNSLFREVTEHYNNENCTILYLEMKTLDNCLINKNIDKIDLLKIDVQGAELLILQGAIDTLKITEFILLEVSILKYNDGAPLFADVIKFMDANNFNVFDIMENHMINNLCFQIDILFICKDSQYTKSIAKLLTNITSDNIY